MNYPIHRSQTQLPAPTQATQNYCQAAAPGVADQVLEYTSMAMGVLQLVAGVVGCFHQGARQAGGQYPTGAPVGVDPNAALQAKMDAEIRAHHAAQTAPTPPPPPAGYAAPMQVTPPAPPAPPVYAQQDPPAVFVTANGRRII